MTLQVHLQSFSGPLALLLHLIREQEMDIFDIDIAKITQQYLDYIKSMRQLDLEVAGEFVAMAATLLQIKSRMLLPQYNDEGEVIESEDPRRELVNRLLEYQKYQDAAKRLSERPWVGRDLWLRGERLQIDAGPDEEIELEDNPLFGLISAYRRTLKAMRTGVHRVVGAMQSVAARILEMKERLIVGEKVAFGTLITAGAEQRIPQVLITFLSLLELAKMGFVSLFQSDNFSEIHIEAQRPIEKDVVSQVESYENVNAAQTAAELTAEPLPLLAAQEAGDEIADASAEMASDEEIAAEEARLELSEEGGVDGQV